MSSELYLIWSFEHRAWWKPSGFRYTLDVERAGRYTLDHAAAIVENANRYRPPDDPCECLVAEDDLAEFAESFLMS